MIPKRHKLYCDLDISFNEEEFALLDHPDVGGKQALVDDIIFSARQAEYILQRGGTDEPHTRFHYREAHKENAHKISFHIVWNHCSEDMRVTRAFSMLFEQCLANRGGIESLTGMPKSVKAYENLVRLLGRPGGFVDFGVYTNNHSLRTAGAAKNFDPYSTLYILPQSLAQGEALSYSHRDLISYTLPTWRPVTADTHQLLRGFMDEITPRPLIVLEARLRSDVLTSYCERVYEEGQDVGLGMLVTTAFHAIEGEYGTPIYSFRYYKYPDRRGMRVNFSLMREENVAESFYWELDVYCRTCTKYQATVSPRRAIVSFFITSSGETRRFSHDFPEEWLDLNTDKLPFYCSNFTLEARHVMQDPLCDRLNSLMASARNGEMCDDDKQLYEEIGHPAADFDERCDVGRFCSELEKRIPLPDKAKVVCVKSACGTGKTTLMKYFLLRTASMHRNGCFDVDTQFEDFSVCFVTVRRTLADTLLQEFNGLPFGDFVDYRTVTGPIRHPRVIVQMDSIERVAHYGFDVVIIDECVSALTHICSSTIGSRRERVYGNLVQALSEARQVLCLDADINNDTVRLVQEMISVGMRRRPFDTHVTVNNMKTDPSRYDIYRNLEPFIETLLGAMLRRKKMVVCCETKKDAYAMKNLVDYLYTCGFLPFYTPQKVGILTGESEAEEKVQMSKNASRTWCKYNLLIITSVIFVGVDHSPALPHFDCIALMGAKIQGVGSRFLDPRQLLQMRWRCRSTNDKRVMIYAPEMHESNVQSLGVFSDSVSMAQYDKLNDVVKGNEFHPMFAAECFHAFFINMTKRFYNTFLTSMVKRQVQDPEAVHIHEHGEPALFVARNKSLSANAISSVEKLIEDNGIGPASQERKTVYRHLQRFINGNFDRIQMTAYLYDFFKKGYHSGVRRFEEAGSIDNLEMWFREGSHMKNNYARISRSLFKQLYDGALHAFGCNDLWQLMSKVHDEDDYDAILETFAAMKPVYKGKPIDLQTFFKLHRVELEVLHFVSPFNASDPGKSYINVMSYVAPCVLPFHKDCCSPKSKFMQVLEAVYFRHKLGYSALSPRVVHFVETTLHMYAPEGTVLRSSFASVLGAPREGVSVDSGYGVLEQSLPTKRILERAYQRCEQLYPILNGARAGTGVQRANAGRRRIIRALSPSRPAAGSQHRVVGAGEAAADSDDEPLAWDSDDEPLAAYEYEDEEETDEEGEHDTGHDGPHRFVAA